MDTQTAISTIEAAIASQQGIANQANTIIEALQAALTVLQNGYTSDQTAIADAIATAKAAALAAVTPTLQ